jgi:hypothetical protein
MDCRGIVTGWLFSIVDAGKKQKYVKTAAQYLNESRLRR